jgi:NADP-dependent 3-hydroxy acid dehydrogenase YdfG
MSQVWLVTGSSRGLCRAIVEASLAAGNKVMATARNTESLNDLSDRYGNQVKLFAFDVIDESAATAAVKTAIDTFGSLDVVVNNAGYGNLSSVEDTPMSDFRQLARPPGFSVTTMESSRAIRKRLLKQSFV